MRRDIFTDMKGVDVIFVSKGRIMINWKGKAVL